MSPGTELRAAEYTSIEKAVPRQMFAKDTAMIGAVNSSSCGGRPSAVMIAFSDPSGAKKVYSRYPATTSGRIQAAITIAVTVKEMIRLARSSSKIGRAHV